MEKRVHWAMMLRQQNVLHCKLVRGRKGSGDAYSRGEDKRRSVVTLERTLTYLFQKLTKHTKHVKEHF